MPSPPIFIGGFRVLSKKGFDYASVAAGSSRTGQSKKKHEKQAFTEHVDTKSGIILYIRKCFDFGGFSFTKVRGVKK